MAKSGKEILEELGNKYHSEIFNNNGGLKWSSIDGTMKSFLELGGTYLEKCSGYGSGPFTEILCVNKSLDYIIRKYGEDDWEKEAAKNGDIARFDPYDHKNTIDSYVCKKYGLKSAQQIQEILNTSVDQLDLNAIDINASEALKDKGINTIGDIVKLEPSELFSKMQDVFGPETHDYDAGVVVGAVMKTGLAWENGESIFNQWQEDGKFEYQETLTKSLSDNVITPEEADSLNEIAEKYGLPKDWTEIATQNYVEKQRSIFGKPRPVIAHLVTPENALQFADCFNKNKHEIEEKEAEFLPGKPVPYFKNMDSSLAENILETLSVDGGYTVYGDLSHNRLWLRDEQTGTTDETNFNHLIAKTQMITESWKRDETTVNENKFIEELDSLRTADILVPVDVRYKFKIPDEIKITSEKDERWLREGIESAIRRVFPEPSEMIKGSVTTSNGEHEADYTFRHNIVCTGKTSYSNLKFAEIDQNLQFVVGVSLNDQFDLDHKILFSELKSTVPETYWLGLRQVDVNKETIENFAKTPAEYSSEATDEMLKTSGVTREQVEATFKSQKQAFDKVLLRNPLLKQYVEEQWRILKEKSKEKAFSIGSFVKDIEDKCGSDKSVKNILAKAAAITKSLNAEETRILKDEFSKLKLNSDKQIKNFLDKKINPKKEIKREISRSRDSDFERRR